MDINLHRQFAIVNRRLKAAGTYLTCMKTEQIESYFENFCDSIKIQGYLLFGYL